MPAPEIADCGMTDDELRALALRFESLGGMSHGGEFGAFQLDLGADPPGLLRWADIGPDALASALETDFYGVGDPDHTVVFDARPGNNEEWWTRDTRHHMAMRSFIKVEDTPYGVAAPAALTRIRQLRDSLMQDLQASEKIFVYRLQFRNLTPPELTRLRRAVRRFGLGTLLIIQHSDPQHPGGTVEWAGEGLLLGYVDRFSRSPEGTPLGKATALLLDVCRKAAALVDATTTRPARPKGPPPTDGEDVVMGADGFVFHTFDGAFENICGPFTLGERDLERWVALIEARHAWCAQRGIRYIFAIVPERHVTYADCLPAGYTVNPDRPVMQIFRRLSDPVRQDCLYFDECLRRERARHQMFFRTDIHWTQRGAYTAYRELVAAIAHTIPMQPVPESALHERVREMRGSLSLRMESRPKETVSVIDYTPDPPVEMTFGQITFRAGQVEVFRGSDPTLPRAVLFRDSNASSQLPFLATHFSRLVVVAAGMLFHDLVRSERPDVVINQMAERYLRRPGSDSVPDDFGPIGFAEFTGITLPLPDWQVLQQWDFTQAGNAHAILGAGWSGPEPDRRWCENAESELSVPIPPATQPRDLELHFEMLPFIRPPELPAQHVTVFANGRRLHGHVLREIETVRVPVPARCIAAGATRLDVRIVHPDGRVPSQLIPDARDNRVLSVAVRHMKLIRA